MSGCDNTMPLPPRSGSPEAPRTSAGAKRVSEPTARIQESQALQSGLGVPTLSTVPLDTGLTELAMGSPGRQKGAVTLERQMPSAWRRHRVLNPFVHIVATPWDCATRGLLHGCT